MILGIFVLGAPVAKAQTTATVITPLTVASDQNDVDITSGKANIRLPTLSTPAAPRLTYDRVQRIVPHLVARISGGSGGYIESSVAVHTGSSTSESFRCLNDDVCANRKADGSTIDGDLVNGSYYIFTESGTGAVYTFDRLEFDNGATQQNRQVQFYASSIQYPDGEVISFTYHTSTYASGAGRIFHRPTQIASNLGYYLNFSYQGNDVNYPAWGNVAQATLYKTGVSTPIGQLSYGTGGSETVTDLAGRTYTCTYCANNAPLSEVTFSSGTVTLPTETNPERVVTGTQYGTANLVSSVVRDGAGWSYAYGNYRNGSNYTYYYDSVTVTAPDGTAQTYGINAGAEGRSNTLSSVTDPLGRTTAYQVDQNLRPTRITAPEGNYVAVQYDANGNIVSKVTQPKPGSGQAAITESAAIDQAACAQTIVLCFRPVSYTDALGRTMEYSYDQAGRLTQETAPADASGVRRVRYISYGASYSAPTLIRTCALGVTCGTAAELRTSYTYLGATALPVSVTETDGAGTTPRTTTYGYDDAGRVVSVDGPKPGSADTAYTRYDVLGRKTWEIAPANYNEPRLAKRYTYRDSDDRVIAVETGTLPDATSTALTVTSRIDTSYDPRRNLAQETASSNGTAFKLAQRTFDIRNRATCEAVRMSPAAYGNLPASACDMGPQGSFGPDRITHNVYDAAGQVLQVQRAYATPLQQNYATYNYTPNGQKASLIDANGNRAEMAYDGFDRQSRWTFPSKTNAGQIDPSDYESYGYDAGGNRTSLRKRDGRMFGYTYDAMNRMVTKAVGDGCAPLQYGGCPPASATRDVYYGYDLRGLQTYARFDSASGEGIGTAYDTFGQVVSTTTTMGGTSRTLGYQYDSVGNRIRIMHPDGTFFTYGYDALDRFNQMYQMGTGGAASVAYDALGRIQNLSLPNVGSGWQYDGMSRLNYLEYYFAGWGSGVTQTMSYNPADEVTAATRSNEQFSYARSTRPTLGYAVNGLNQYTSVGTNAYRYDANGNLTSDGGIGYGYGASNELLATSTGAQLDYDPLGRLWRITKNGSETQFLYDGDAMVAEYGASGQRTQLYFHAPGDDRPLLWYEGGVLNDAGLRSLQPDRLGSIIAATNVNGTPLAINTYDEYGVPGSGNGGRFQYTGQMWLAELGMYYYKARIYAPMLGRFLQVDPIGYADQNNLYAYVGNDPVNGTDPSGMVCTGTNVGNCDGGISPSSSGWSTGSATGNGTYQAAKSGNAGSVTPGGPISEGQTACRSCHGVDTPDDMRYSTDTENAGLEVAAAVITAFIPGINIASEAKIGLAGAELSGKAAALILPDGINASRFGQIAGWPRSLRDSGIALQQGVLARISFARSAAIRFRSGGVSYNVISKYAVFYAQQAAKNPNNTSAVYRSKVLYWTKWMY